MIKEWKITLPELTGKEKRKAYVYVPDVAYAEPERRYPVLYMFDGHNLFRDSDASYGKSWGLLQYLTQHDVPLMVAAIECNHHAEEESCGGRLSEYAPFDFSDPGWGTIRGRGALTMDYYTRVFKPYIDKKYPTLPDREHTFIGGSSMGGLMTLFALAAYGDTFSRGAALSPSVDFSPGDVKEMIRSARWKDKVLYMEPDHPRRLPLRGVLGAADPLLPEYAVLRTGGVRPWRRTILRCTARRWTGPCP